MSDPIDATDGHRCGEGECTDDEPVVLGRWLRFLNIDHDGLTWVPLANITRVQSNDKYLDVTHTTPTDDDAENGRPHNETATWDRIFCPAPWRTAAQIAAAS